MVRGKFRDLKRAREELAKHSEKKLMGGWRAAQHFKVQAESGCRGFRMLRQECQQQHKGLKQTAKLHVFSETPGKESATDTVEDVALLRFQMS